MIRARSYSDLILPPHTLARLQKELGAANTGSMNSKDELKWAPSGGFQVSATLLRGMVWGLVQELVQTGRRLTGRYDRAVYRAASPAHQVKPVAEARADAQASRG